MAPPKMSASLRALLTDDRPFQGEPYVAHQIQPTGREEFAAAARGKKYHIRSRHVPRVVLENFPNLQTVSDGLGPVQVTVTSRDQQGSNPKIPSSCAMARACTRELQIDGAIIGLGTSYLIQGTHAVRFDTPATLSREITSFDRHGAFEAGIYGLSPVSKANRFDARPRATGTPKGAKPRRPRLLHKTAGVRTLREPPK